MKSLGLCWMLLCLLAITPGAHSQEALELAAGKVTLKLVSGDTMTGTVSGVRDGSVNLITEYGPIRVPVAKLSAETKTRLGISEATDAASLQARVRELEDLVARLREENATLRQAAASRPAAAPVAPAAGSGVRPSPAPAEGVRYRMSSTGKRHNSRCRYFDSKGRDCGANDGVACKVCGG